MPTPAWPTTESLERLHAGVPLKKSLGESEGNGRITRLLGFEQQRDRRGHVG